MSRRGAISGLGIVLGWFFLRCLGSVGGHAPHQVRDTGAQYILFPETAAWWLEHYPDLARHLKDCAREVPVSSGRCSLFLLRSAVLTKATDDEPNNDVGRGEA